MLFNKTSFNSLRCRFGGGKKNFIQKKGEIVLSIFGKTIKE